LEIVQKPNRLLSGNIFAFASLVSKTSTCEEHDNAGPMQLDSVSGACLRGGNVITLT
jgi:hypothetical protein